MRVHRDFVDDSAYGDDDFVSAPVEKQTVTRTMASAKAPSNAPAGAERKEARVRIRPMPEKMAERYAGVVSVAVTFEDGRQTIYLKKRGK